jgi:AcrR family transcriptional regulator
VSETEERVARYGQEHKQATRQRIIEAAGRRFKKDGIDGSGIATLMADAGLTNGAFYAHFTSKQDLVATVIAHQLRAQAAARGLPILGDGAYGSTRAFSGGIALHARALSVRHPILRSELDLIAPLPRSWWEQGIVLPESSSSSA